MPEPVWYYARGEVERGPFTTVQIKALAQAGKLRPDDLVWKEGMENWTSAVEVADLFPAGAPVEAKPSTSPSISAASEDTNAGPTFTPLTRSFPQLGLVGTWVGRGCLLVGLFGVVTARGCESLGERRVTRLTATLQLDELSQWQQQRDTLMQELVPLESRERLTNGEQERFKELRDQLQQLEAGRPTDEVSSPAGSEIDRAASEHRSGAFARGATYYGGVVFLLLGGLALAFAAEGIDRWLGIGVLLIVCWGTLSSSGAW